MTDRVNIIVAAVAAEHGLTAREIMAPTHLRAIARPRQIAMTLCRDITGQSWPKLAMRFTGASSGEQMHHTTVMWAHRETHKRREKDDKFAALYARCEERAEAYLNDPKRMIDKTLDERIAALSGELAALEERRADQRRAAMDARLLSPKATASGRSAA